MNPMALFVLGVIVFVFLVVGLGLTMKEFSELAEEDSPEAGASFGNKPIARP